MAFDTETIVVGAGVVGLATARALALKGGEVIILEQHELITQGFLAPVVSCGGTSATDAE